MGCICICAIVIKEEGERENINKKILSNHQDNYYHPELLLEFMFTILISFLVTY